MSFTNAGILMYQFQNNSIRVLLLHPGGPFFRNKDQGAWSIPKGLPQQGEDLEHAAVREFKEETGIELKNKLLPLGRIRQKGGKIVHAWATKGDLPKEFILKSNLFELEWPPKSGKMQQFPEMDKAAFFFLDEAKEKINPAQVELIERLEKELKYGNHG